METRLSKCARTRCVTQLSQDMVTYPREEGYNISSYSMGLTSQNLLETIYAIFHSNQQLHFVFSVGGVGICLPGFDLFFAKFRAFRKTHRFNPLSWSNFTPFQATMASFCPNQVLFMNVELQS